MTDDDISKLLEDLADSGGETERVGVCETIAEALTALGHIPRVAGYMTGPDRASGSSPFGFGDDDAVGVATVAQIGGELATGAVELLKAGNRYAASALTRQLVEIEYLASAFANQDKVAADWLHADRKQRLDFWSPKALRKRAGGRFVDRDYWLHCEMGGHPTTAGMRLLPGHKASTSPICGPISPRIWWRFGKQC